MRDLILYVGNYFFPNGNAAGKRVSGNIAVIDSLGFATATLNFRPRTEESEKTLKKKIINGVLVYEIPYRIGFKRLNNAKPYKAFRKVYENLKRHGYRVVMIIMYGTLGTNTFNEKVIRYAHNENIKVCYDLVDWFDKPTKSNILRYFMKKRELNRLDCKVLSKCDAWITISSLLKSRMPNPSKTVIMPPLSVDNKHATEKNVFKKDIVFSYASVLPNDSRPVEEWKDRIDVIIDVFYLLMVKNNIENFHIKFIGFTKKELINMFLPDVREKYSRKIDKLGDKIDFLGICDNEIVEKEIQQSDFTVLFRDNKLSTNCGFPTKVSESVANGIPVLANATSDIANYIIDGVNGYLLPDPSALDVILERMIKVMHLRDSEISSLKDSTYKAKTFYFEQYKDKMKVFINEVTGS